MTSIVGPVWPQRWPGTYHVQDRVGVWRMEGVLVGIKFGV